MTSMLRKGLVTTALLAGFTVQAMTVQIAAAEAGSFDRLVSVFVGGDERAEAGDRSVRIAAADVAGGGSMIAFGQRRSGGEVVNPDWAELVVERLDAHLSVLAPSSTSRSTLAAVVAEVIANVRTTRAATRERLAVSLKFSLMAHARSEALAASPRYSYELHSGVVTLIAADAGEDRATVVDAHDLLDRIAAATICAEVACVDRALDGGVPGVGPA